MTEWLLVIIVVNVFIFILCLIIILCNKFLKQSGKIKLISGETEKEAECGQTLLSACMSSGIYLPAACGGKGTCGKCAVKIISGGSPVTTLEKLQLKSYELENGLRLSCQVRVRNDIELDPSVMAKAATAFKANLVKIEQVTDRIKILSFEYSSGHIKQFKAGQYIQLNYALPWEKITRAYSVSSINQNGFSLDVQAIPGGLVSNYLHSLKEGTELEFSGAYGDMYLPNVLTQKSIILAAGGVGLAPIRAIANELLEKEYSGSIFLFQGARNRSSLYNEQTFNKLADKHKNFHYFPALSEPELQDGWNGFEGMIHELIDKKITEIENIECFICGPKPMMEATENILYKKGVTSDRIHKDPFD